MCTDEVSGSFNFCTLDHKMKNRKASQCPEDGTALTVLKNPDVSTFFFFFFPNWKVVDFSMN